MNILNFHRSKYSSLISGAPDYSFNIEAKLNQSKPEGQIQQVAKNNQIQVLTIFKCMIFFICKLKLHFIYNSNLNFLWIKIS